MNSKAQTETRISEVEVDFNKLEIESFTATKMPKARKSWFITIRIEGSDDEECQKDVQAIQDLTGHSKNDWEIVAVQTTGSIIKRTRLTQFN